MALLVYADTDGVERSFTVGTDPVVVGRASECAIRSTDPRVSRNHARFYLDHTGTLHVEDLGSSNGVFVGQHKVLHSAVPINELVLVGSLTFRLVSQQPAAPEPPLQQVEWTTPATQPAGNPWQQPNTPSAPVTPASAWAQPQQPAYPQQGFAPPPHDFAPPPAYAPPAMPPPLAPPAMPSGPSAAELEAERKGRLAAEEERDAYGARMAQALGELHTLKQTLEQTRAELAKARVPVGDGEMQQRIAALLEERDRLSAELDTVRTQLSDTEDQVKSAEARLRSAEDELTVARSDVTAAEERIVSEIAAHEERSSAELTSRVEELNVTRADLIKAEDRILELSRTIAELEQKLASR